MVGAEIDSHHSWFNQRSQKQRDPRLPEAVHYHMGRERHVVGIDEHQWLPKDAAQAVRFPKIFVGPLGSAVCLKFGPFRAWRCNLQSACR